MHATAVGGKREREGSDIGDMTKQSRWCDTVVALMFWRTSDCENNVIVVIFIRWKLPFSTLSSAIMGVS